MLVVLLSAFLLAPCEWEDSANCHWDAETRGNGQGESFVDIAGLRVRY